MYVKETTALKRYLILFPHWKMKPRVYKLLYRYKEKQKKGYREQGGTK